MLNVLIRDKNFSTIKDTNYIIRKENICMRNAKFGRKDSFTLSPCAGISKYVVVKGLFHANYVRKYSLISVAKHASQNTHWKTMFSILVVLGNVYSGR
jgi:hypothetical protein